MSQMQTDDALKQKIMLNKGKLPVPTGGLGPAIGNNTTGPAYAGPLAQAPVATPKIGQGYEANAYQRGVDPANPITSIQDRYRNGNQLGPAVGNAQTPAVSYPNPDKNPYLSGEDRAIMGRMGQYDRNPGQIQNFVAGVPGYTAPFGAPAQPPNELQNIINQRYPAGNQVSGGQAPGTIPNPAAQQPRPVGQPQQQPIGIPQEYNTESSFLQRNLDEMNRRNANSARELGYQFGNNPELLARKVATAQMLNSLRAQSNVYNVAHDKPSQVVQSPEDIQKGHTDLYRQGLIIADNKIKDATARLNSGTPEERAAAQRDLEEGMAIKSRFQSGSLAQPISDNAAQTSSDNQLGIATRQLKNQQDAQGVVSAIRTRQLKDMQAGYQQQEYGRQQSVAEARGGALRADASNSPDVIEALKKAEIARAQTGALEAGSAAATAKAKAAETTSKMAGAEAQAGLANPDYQQNLKNLVEGVAALQGYLGSDRGTKVDAIAGNWSKIKSYIDSLPPEQAKVVKQDLADQMSGAGLQAAPGLGDKFAAGADWLNSQIGQTPVGMMIPGTWITNPQRQKMRFSATQKMTNLKGEIARYLQQ